MALTLKLTVNGEEKVLPLERADLAALLSALSIPSEHVVIEKNGEIFKGTDAIDIANGDSIEILRFMGGGARASSYVTDARQVSLKKRGKEFSFPIEILSRRFQNR